MGNGKDELDKKGCEYGRNLRKDVEYMRKDLQSVINEYKDRPSWEVVTALTILTNLVVGLAVALLT